jgi:hypothetical protein
LKRGRLRGWKNSGWAFPDVASWRGAALAFKSWTKNPTHEVRRQKTSSTALSEFEMLAVLPFGGLAWYSAMSTTPKFWVCSLCSKLLHIPMETSGNFCPNLVRHKT